METSAFQMPSEVFESENVYPLPLSHHPPDFFSGECDEESMDLMLCSHGSRFLKRGFNHMDLSESEGFLMFVNAGGGKIQGLNCSEDGFFKGGDIMRTEEKIIEGGSSPSIYQCARFGNFCYVFDNLEPGEYFIDLHFAEIVNTNGPRGMRVFDVFVQGEKALAALDVYSCVGANRPLQVVDIRAAVAQHGDAITIRFESVIGSPLLSGICIRRAPKLPASLINPNYVVCNKCCAQVEVPANQIKDRSLASLAKLEKKNQELVNQYKLKTDECYEAWMMLSEANDKLEKLQIELEKKTFQFDSQDHALEVKEAMFREAIEKYENGKKFWTNSIDKLKEHIQVLRRDYVNLSEEAHGCATSIPDLNKMTHAVQSLVRQCEDLKMKYSKEQVERKKLYNKVLEIKGNIRVFCRCRPLSKEEISSGSVMVADFEAAKEGELGINTGGGGTKKTFKFDRVYTPKDDQVDVFSDASALVVSVLDGYNVCIFAYGQTGTGKTFTMEGTEQSRGVNYRTLQELFRIANERRETVSYEIFISVLEVYNEQIRDLLDPAPSSKKLEVRQEAEGVHHVPGVVEAKVNNIQEVWKVFQCGSNARAVGSNNVNEHSSRSHCMICITVRAKSLMNGECTKSKLWLVDLAGSERLAKTDARGERLNEAKNINRSLSALGDVISALATKSSHVPFRNSKLTHLLQDSLGGDSKTLMFVQISPSDKDLGETLSSLSFAARVRGVELGPAKRQVDVGEHQKQKSMLDRAKQELKLKDDSVRQLEEGCQNLEVKLKGKELQCKSYQEKIKELEGCYDLKIKEFQNQLERQRLQFEEILKDKDGICRTLQQKVKELESKLKEQQQGSSTPMAAELLKCEIDSYVLRSSDSLNRPASRDRHSQPESILLRGADSLQEIKRKRETKMGPVDSENSIPLTTSLLDKKAIPSDIKRLRQIDSSKAYGRLSRTSRGGTQKVVSASKLHQGGWR
ncbi:kinesin-like protein KIN-14R [Nymphaea colorata]|nr:kinesin-like protein KIN-14R [Nymphaea colorata]